MSGESLANGGRLGLSALNIKKYKDQALSDEILLNKDAGLFYYKNPEGNFISMDLGIAKQSYINTIRNELDDMGIVDYNLTDLNIDPGIAIADRNIITPTGDSEYFVNINTRTLEQMMDDYLYLGLDVIGFYNTNNGYGKELSILDSFIPTEMVVSPSTNLSVEYTIPFDKRIVKLSDYVTEPPSGAYPVIKSIKITDMSSAPSNVNYYALNAFIVAMKYQ